MQIPKIIHYCWYGGKAKPKLVKKCIASWVEHLPDYEIIEWNEKNTDLSHPFVKESYSQKKWAFITDYIRLKILYEYGGIYLDTDMMILKSLNGLLSYKCFLGAEETKIVSGGIIGTIKSQPFIKECLANYDLINNDSKINFNEIVIPKLLTNTYERIYGVSLFDKIIKKNNLVVYPPSYFYPLPNILKKDIKKYKEYIEESTYAVHLWNASWVEYDEFYYLRNRKYIKASLRILKKIILIRDINFYYFKRIYNNLLKSFK